ncbi:hypothetical protein HPB49_011094 [Dermacentor silvarum]|uniref:Uncharacterized protein n=1 Tax=Dermacentor silvarum TaxID=543639 RepID=A0ACB8DZU8_DERSI|nr:hypothetical protein HPB49_011094 [Dermacentor silvarum]
MPECDAAPCSVDAYPPGRPRVAVYVRAALPHARVPTDHLCSAMIECVAVTVRVRGTNTSVASVYVRAGARRANYSFVVRLTALLSPDTVVCGDFNAHHRDWGSARSNARGGDLSSAVAAAGLTVLNSGEATFVRRDGVATVIDLALVSERCSYSWQRAPDTAGSDHYPITLCPTKPRSRRHARVRCRAVAALTRDVCETCAGRATTRVIVPAGTPCPDIKLLNVRAARRRAQRRAVRSGAAADWTTYNRLDAVCRRHARQLRRRSWAGLYSSLARPRNQHRGWRVLNALLNPRTPRFPVLAIAVAQGISELALAEQLADAFAAAATAPLLGVPAVALRALYVAVFVRGGDQSTHVQAITSLCEEDFTFHELQQRADGVTHQMLRNLDEDQRHFLLDAFNGVLRSGCLPESWRCALVVPVLKSGKPPRSLASYRPVSLTSVPGKTMEAMALSRLQWIADIRGVFPPEQCGFRTHRSTADCLAAVVGTLEQASRDGHAAFLLLLDVQSAFDSLPHDTIISAVRALGVGGRLLAYVRAFLTDSECVRSSGHLPVRTVVYADDVALFVRGPPATMAQMRLQLQAAADAVGDFLRAIGLRLSEAIMVHPRAAVRRHTGCVVVDGVPLPWRLTVRYLGLTIDHRLTWLPAVKRLRAAMRQVEGAVRALLGRGDGCPPSPPLALSRVLYALPLCNLRPHLWRRINGDHRRVLRMCHGLPSASRVAETLAETGAWPVSLTADLRALGHLERLSRGPGAGPMLSYLRELPKSHKNCSPCRRSVFVFTSGHVRSTPANEAPTSPSGKLKWALF